MSEAIPSLAPDRAEILAALRDLEGRCLANAAGLPQPEAGTRAWAGVLFRVGPFSLLAPLEETSEVLEVPRDIAPIPGVKSWVCGMANNRGTLLPIFDLRAFLLATPTPRQPGNRVLVALQDGLPFGLLVDEVVGIRHFDVSARKPLAANGGLASEVADLLSGGFPSGPDVFPVFSPRRLGLDARFAAAAA